MKEKIMPPLVLMLICSVCCALLVIAYELTYVDTTGMVTDKMKESLVEIYGTSDGFEMLKNEDGTVNSLDAAADKAKVDSVLRDANGRCAFEITASGYSKDGLYMLVGQAVAAVEIFLDRKLDPDALDRVFDAVLASKESIVLTGMPGSGKTTVGRLLAQKLGRPFYDSDDEITSRTGRTPNEIIRADGEAAFRDIEADVIAALSLEPGCVIATGGGAILRHENIRHLRANGRIFFLDRPLDDILPTDDRPLSADRAALQKRYDERYPVYTATADAVIPVRGTPEDVASAIQKEFTR